jgi:hypothetical protein
LEILAHIYPNMTKFQPGTPKPMRELERKGGGVRRKITRLSRKSRNHMIEKLCRLEELPDYFLTLTLADSFIDRQYGEYPGPEELSRRIHRDFNKWTQRPAFQACVRWYMWRLEFEPRKSGEYIGKMFPHMHMMVALKQMGSEQVELAQVWRIMTEWNLQVKGCDDHLRVTLHRKSYQKLDGRKLVYTYFSKYSAKTSEPIEMIDNETGEVFHVPIGRQWGFSKNAPISEGYLVCLPRRTAAGLRRVLRKSVKKRMKDAVRKGWRYRPGVYFWDQLTNKEMKFRMIFPAKDVEKFLHFSAPDEVFYPLPPPPF